MSSIGFATLQVIPSLRNMESEVNKQLGGLTGVSSRVGGQAGRGFISNFGANVTSGLDRVGGAITSRIGTGLKVGAATAAAGFAASLVAGFGRLRAIDDARFKLQGLGHDARTVESIMESALASVKGTAFGLGDAATIAASAVAAGIPPGEDLTRVLSLTGDAASIAGTSLGDMGAIFGKVAAGNRMMTLEMNQLTDRGLPVLQWLQDEFNVTADVARDMVSSGAVDFATFAKIIEDNIGGAALTAGGAFTGALANVGAAIGRFGAAVLGPAFNAAPALFQRIIDAVDQATDWVTPRIEGIAQQFTARLLPAIERAADFFTGTFVPALRDARDWFDENRDTIQRVAAAVVPAVGILAGLATATHLVRRAWMLLAAATPLGIVLALTSGLVFAWQNSERFRQIVTNAFEAVRGAVERVVGWFRGGDGLEGAFTSVRGLMDSLQPRFDAIRGSFARIGEAVGPVVSWLGERLPGAFQALWSVAQPILGFLVSLIGDTLKMAIDGIVQTFQGAVSVIAGILDVFAGLFTGDWTRLWEGIKSIASGFFNLIVGLVKTWLAVSVFKVIGAGLKAIAGLFTRGWSAIRGIFANAGSSITATVRGWVDTVRLHIWQAMDAIRGAIRAAWDAIRSIFSGGTGFVREVVTGAFSLVRTTIANAMSAVRGTVSNAMNAVRTSISDGISRVLSLIRDLPGQIVRALGNLNRLLWDSGRAIIDGLIGGITSMAGRVRDAINRVLESARALLPFSPAKEGPFSGRGWTVYAGRSIVEGLAEGIGQRSRLVEVATRDLAARARSEMAAALPQVAGLAPMRTAAAVEGSVAGRTVNVTVHNPAPEPASVSVSRQMRKLAVAGVFDDV